MYILWSLPHAAQLNMYVGSHSVEEKVLFYNYKSTTKRALLHMIVNYGKHGDKYRKYSRFLGKGLY